MNTWLTEVDDWPMLFFIAFIIFIICFIVGVNDDRELAMNRETVLNAFENMVKKLSDPYSSYVEPHDVQIVIKFLIRAVERYEPDMAVQAKLLVIASKLHEATSLDRFERELLTVYLQGACDYASSKYGFDSRVPNG